MALPVVNTDAFRNAVRKTVGGSSGSKRGTSAQKDAFAFIQDKLDQYGLGGMARAVWDFMLANGTDDENQVLLWLYEQQPFKERFPAIFIRREKGMNAVTPAEYVAYETQARQLMRAAGMPTGFYDADEDFTNLIAQDVSLNELNQRISNGWQQVAQAPAAVRDAFAQYFGPEGDNALAAWFLDPDRAAPVLQGYVNQARIGGAARMAGIGGILNQGLASQIASQGLDFREALVEFQRLADISALFTETYGEGRGSVTPDVAGSRPAWALNAVSQYEQSLAAHNAKLDELRVNPFIKATQGGAQEEAVRRAASATGLRAPARPDDAYRALGTEVGAIPGGPGDLRLEVEGVQAQFSLDPMVRQQVQRRLAERQAAFAGMGGSRLSQVGLGVGSAY